MRRSNTRRAHARDNTLSFRTAESKPMASHSDPAHAHHHHGTYDTRVGSNIDHVRLFCAEEVELWKKITMIGSVAVCGVLLNWMAGEHHHMHKPPP